MKIYSVFVAELNNLMNSDTTPTFPSPKLSLLQIGTWNLRNRSGRAVSVPRATCRFPGLECLPIIRTRLFHRSLPMGGRHVMKHPSQNFGPGRSLREGLCWKLVWPWPGMAEAVPMAEEEAKEEKGMPLAASRIDAALPLLDFDWKLKYAVASGSIATVNKSFLRLELYTSKFASKVQVPEHRRTLPDSQTRTSVAEYSKAELDELIQEMDGIVQALEGVESATR